MFDEFVNDCSEEAAQRAVDLARSSYVLNDNMEIDWCLLVHSPKVSPLDESKSFEDPKDEEKVQLSPSKRSTAHNRSQNTDLNELIHVLRNCGLKCTIDPLQISDSTLIGITAPRSILEAEAHAIGLLMRTRNGQYEPFNRFHVDRFLGADHHVMSMEQSSRNFDLFTSFDRQMLVERIVRKSVADGGAGIDTHRHTWLPLSYWSCTLKSTVTPLSTVDESNNDGTIRVLQSFPMQMMAKVKTLRLWWRWWEVPNTRLWANDSAQQQQQVDENSFDLINWWRSSKLGWLCSALFYQPLDDAARYIGTDLTFLFAFHQFVTVQMLLPLVMSIVLLATQLQVSSLDSPVVPFYCVSLSLWSVWMLSKWKTTQSQLAARWGVDALEKTEEDMRVEFLEEFDRVPAAPVGPLSEILILQRKFPLWKRRLRLLGTSILWLAFTGLYCTLLVYFLKCVLSLAFHHPAHSRGASACCPTDCRHRVHDSHGMSALDSELMRHPM